MDMPGRRERRMGTGGATPEPFAPIQVHDLVVRLDVPTLLLWGSDDPLVDRATLEGPRPAQAVGDQRL